MVVSLLDGQVDSATSADQEIWAFHRQVLFSRRDLWNSSMQRCVVHCQGPLCGRKGVWVSIATNRGGSLTCALLRLLDLILRPAVLEGMDGEASDRLHALEGVLRGWVLTSRSLQRQVGNQVRV